MKTAIIFYKHDGLNESLTMIGQTQEVSLFNEMYSVTNRIIKKAPHMRGHLFALYEGTELWINTDRDANKLLQW